MGALVLEGSLGMCHPQDQCSNLAKEFHAYVDVTQKSYMHSVSFTCTKCMCTKVHKIALAYRSGRDKNRKGIVKKAIRNRFLRSMICIFSLNSRNKYRKFCSLLKVDVLILICISLTFTWLTLTSEMHFVKFHPEVASCLVSRGKRKYAPLGMRLWWKYIRNYFLVYQLTLHFLSYLQNYKEFEADILDLQLEKYGLSFDIKKCTTSGWALGDENGIGIRSFK